MREQHLLLSLRHGRWRKFTLRLCDPRCHEDPPIETQIVDAHWEKLLTNAPGYNCKACEESPLMPKIEHILTLRILEAM